MMPSVGASLAVSSAATSGGNVAFNPIHIFGRGNKSTATNDQTYDAKSSSEATAKTDLGGGGMLGGLGGAGGGGLTGLLGSLGSSIAGLFGGSSGSADFSTASADGGDAGPGGYGKWLAIGGSLLIVVVLGVVLLKRGK